MYRILVSNTCVEYMYRIHISNTCMEYLCRIFVPDGYMYRIHVSDVRSKCMYRLLASNTYIEYEYRTHGIDYLLECIDDSTIGLLQTLTCDENKEFLGQKYYKMLIKSAFKSQRQRKPQTIFLL